MAAVGMIWKVRRTLIHARRPAPGRARIVGRGDEQSEALSIVDVVVRIVGRNHEHGRVRSDGRQDLKGLAQSRSATCWRPGDAVGLVLDVERGVPPGPRGKGTTAAARHRPPLCAGADDLSRDAVRNVVSAGIRTRSANATPRRTGPGGAHRHVGRPDLPLVRSPRLLGGAQFCPWSEDQLPDRPRVGVEPGSSHYSRSWKAFRPASPRPAIPCQALLPPIPAATETLTACVPRGPCTWCPPGGRNIRNADVPARPGVQR